MGWIKALDIIPASFHTSWDTPHKRGGIPELIGGKEYSWYWYKDQGTNFLIENWTTPTSGPVRFVPW